MVFSYDDFRNRSNRWRAALPGRRFGSGDSLDVRVRKAAMLTAPFSGAPMSSTPPHSDDERVVRLLISELIRFKEAGDTEGVDRINKELRDVMSRPVLPHSTIRRVPF